MMRTDTRFSRVRTMLEDECPRDADGRFEVCHTCQRAAYHAHGFLRLLTRDIARLATFKVTSPLCCPRCGSDRINALGGKAGERGLHKCYACRKPFTKKSAGAARSSHLPDAVWLRAEALFGAGMSARRVAAEVGVTHVTAWKIRMRLEAARALGAANADTSERSVLAREEP